MGQHRGKIPARGISRITRQAPAQTPRQGGNGVFKPTRTNLLGALNSRCTRLLRFNSLRGNLIDQHAQLRCDLLSIRLARPHWFIGFAKLSKGGTSLINSFA